MARSPCLGTSECAVVPSPADAARGRIAVVIATLGVAGAVIAVLPAFAQSQGDQILAVMVAAALLAVVGGIDDMRSLPEAPRLLLQFVAAGAVVAALPNEFHVLPQLPWSIERALLFFGLVWFVNTVNFMDGIDWLTVAEVVPITGTLALLGLCGAIGLLPTLVAATLLGAILGFAPSISRLRGYFSAMRAACRSAFCLAGCCWRSPARAMWRQH